jgi:hypothetical protein
VFLIIFAFCCCHFVIPSNWHLARIQPVAKKGDLTCIQNYRPISLTEVPRKIFEKCLLPVLTSIVEPLNIEQGGFRSHRGCYDQVSFLQEFLSQKKGCPSNTLRNTMSDHWCAFLDIKAAYDSVDRSLLWSRCAHVGLPGNVIAILQALFDNNCSYIALNGCKSESFPISSGVLQGSLLSPILYSVFIDGLIDYLRLHGPGIIVGGKRLNCLLYADDIALLANCAEDLQTLLNLCNKYSIDFRFRFNVGKCALFVPPSSRHRKFFLYDEVIPIVDVFTYLGFEFRQDGIDWELHFKRMIGRARKTLFFLRDLGCNGHGFSLKSNLELYRSLVRPIVEYSLALCPKSYVQLIELFHNECLRVLAGVGKNACSATIGLFGDLETTLSRWECLNFRYWRSLSRKNSDDYVVKRAEAQFRLTKNRQSVFSSFGHNSFIKEYESSLGMRRFLNDGEEVGFSLKEMKERAKLDLPLQYSSAFIFGCERAERRCLQKFISSLNRRSQRNMVLWVLNQVGRWLKCPKCLDPGGKIHFENCLLKLTPPTFGPSRIEEMLFEDEFQHHLEAVDLLDEVFVKIRDCGRVSQAVV